MARFDYTRPTGATPPAHDFVPAIGLPTACSQMVPGWPPARFEGCRHFCATPVPQGIWVLLTTVENQASRDG